MDIYVPACNRMHRHLKIGNNKLTWDFKCASDLKISQNIYDYVINTFLRDNKTLQDTNNILIKEGIYYKIKYNTASDVPKTKTAQTIYKGNLHFNMRVCCSLIKNRVTGPLTNYIDIEQSEGWESDYFGGSRIYESAYAGGKPFHYCISIMNRSVCIKPDLEICTYDYNNSINDPYEMAKNCHHAPLVTVRNRPAYEGHYGRI